MITNSGEIEKGVRKIYRIERRPSEYRSKYRGKRNGKTVTRVCMCPDCDREFQVFITDIKTGRGEFCSRGCATRSWSVRFDRPIIKHDIEKCLGLLYTAARWATDQRPIEETDEFQDGFMGLHYACNNYRGPGAFSTYAIFNIRNAIKRGQYPLWKGKNRLYCFGIFCPGVAESPVEAAIFHELQQDIRAAIETLKEPAKTRLYEYYFLGLTYAEIAKRHGVSRQRINQSLHRSYEILAKLLQSWREENDTNIATPAQQHTNRHTQVVDAADLPSLDTKRVELTETIEAVIAQLCKTETAVERVDKLSNRQIEVLALAIAGYSINQIASRLGRAVRHVTYHRAEICKKLNLPGMANIVQIASQAGLDREAKRILGERRAA